MFPEAPHDRGYEFHSTMAATYAAAARLHSELASEFEASGEHERAVAERTFAAHYEMLARIAHESVGECAPYFPDSRSRACKAVEDGRDG